MKLNEFIAQSLVAIVEGVAKAQQDTKDSGAIVGPDFDSGNDREGAITLIRGESNVYAYEVEFDIAVAAESERGANASAGISVLSLDFLRVGAKSTQTETNTSRIRFKVPVVLPPHPSNELKEGREQRRREQDAAIRRSYEPFARG